MVVGEVAEVSAADVLLGGVPTITVDGNQTTAGEDPGEGAILVLSKLILADHVTLGGGNTNISATERAAHFYLLFTVCLTFPCSIQPSVAAVNP